MLAINEVSAVKDSSNVPPKAGAARSTRGSVDPNTVAPGGCAGALVSAFFEMIKYAKERLRQSWEVTKLSTEAAVGVDGKKGLLQLGMEQGLKAAEQGGKELFLQAIGTLASAVVGAVTVGGSLYGMYRYQSNGVSGKTERAKVNTQLTDAKNYKEMLSNSAVNHSADIKVANVKELAPDAVKINQHKQNMIDGIDLDKYSKNPKEVQAAANAMEPGERTKAIQKAQKHFDKLDNKLTQTEGRQQNIAGLCNLIGQAGQSGSQAGGGMAAADARTQATTANATKEAVGQATKSNDDLQRESVSNAHEKANDMSQSAIGLAQALQAIASRA